MNASAIAMAACDEQFNLRGENSNRLTDKIHRLENEQNSLSSQIQILTQQLKYEHDTINQFKHLRQQQNQTKFVNRNSTMNHQTDNHHFEQQQTILNSFDFLNEINQFKNRLDTLEKERYELEEKVRRLQEENTNYKNRFIKENNQWIGSRSILALSGHTNLSAFTGNKCFMM
ncbi:unnamed protein product [Rotaria sp. Silwood2]|nr:unnamed protein product [Rotaria sp. Silwood2]